jgi:hypothetical protein
VPDGRVFACDEHRTGRVVHQSLAYAAEDQLAESATSPRADHEEVITTFAGRLPDLFGGIPIGDLHLGFDSALAEISVGDRHVLMRVGGEPAMPAGL